LSGTAGELAAVVAAACFSLSSTFFTLAGRRVGASMVNRVRLLLAVALAMALHAATRGEALPFGASPRAWVSLVLSGVIGLALGDASLFRAYVRIGPALSMLIFSSAPVVTAILGLVLLGERLTVLEWTGVALTLLGIAWVVSEPRRRLFHAASGSYRAGILLAAGGALGQALGLLTAKVGLAEGVPAQSANLMRLVGAAVAIWMVAFATGTARGTKTAVSNDPRAALYVSAGTAAGPLFGVWLSMVAIGSSRLGIASTLMSLTPVFLLPIARVVFSEPVSGRAVTGTAVALSGAAILLG
jgi:drug/metabolite transporter (DMT)-like permease